MNVSDHFSSRNIKLLITKCVAYFTGSMRKSSPIVVVSLLILMLAFGFSTVGNTKRDTKTVYGAVLYVTGGRDRFYHLKKK